MAEPNIFKVEIAYDQPTARLLPGAVADVYADTDTAFITPLTLTGLDGTPMAQLVANDQGAFPAFKVDSVTVYETVIAKSGSYLTAITSTAGTKGDPGDAGPAGEGIPPLEDGEPGQVVVHAGTSATWGDQAAGGGSSITGAPAAWPSNFPSSPHSHPVTQVSDATVVGRALVTALDAQAARSAIGAGTGSGTSNLALGTSGTTAMPGNRTFGSTEIGRTAGGGLSSTTVEGALLELAASSGGAGATNTRYTRWSSGQYPTLPTTKPAGVEFWYFLGPATPTNANVSGGIPAYIGDGPTQIPGEYKVRAFT